MSTRLLDSDRFARTGGNPRRQLSAGSVAYHVAVTEIALGLAGPANVAWRALRRVTAEIPGITDAGVPRRQS